MKNSTCTFRVINMEDIKILIDIFSEYKLNTTKYLDFLDWKKAYNIYINRED